jgi:hypothetical protein
LTINDDRRLQLTIGGPDAGSGVAGHRTGVFPAAAADSPIKHRRGLRFELANPIESSIVNRQ